MVHELAIKTHSLMVLNVETFRALEIDADYVFIAATEVAQNVTSVQRSAVLFMC
jgi:hypothetical protein